MIIPDQKELELIKKFRESLESQDLDLTPKIYYQDLQLLRWIRTTGHDLKKSEEMIKKSINWRKDIGADELINWEPPEFMKKLLEIQYLGKDKQGNCVFLSPQKNWDLAKFSDESQKENFEKFYTKLNEIYMRFICDGFDPEKCQGLAQVVVIYDYKGIPVSQLMNFRAMERMREKNEHYEANYPEMFGNAFLVNVPKAFFMLFQMLKPIASKGTMQKFFISPVDPPRWKASILNQVPCDILPETYGGIRRSPTLHICSRKEIAVNLRASEGEGEQLEEGLIPLTIAASQLLSIDFEIQEPHTLINLMVKVNSHDIGLSVVKVGNSEQVVPFERVSMKKSVLIADAPAKYSLLLDNTYSRSRSKTVNYNILLQPNC